ncbi:MAG: CPBP family intramembrane glutamic endopeptidase [Myxococcota bacterium]
MIRDTIAAARELAAWVREHAAPLFLTTVAAFPCLFYAAHGPPADLKILPSMAVSLFLVLPLWAVTVHDARDRASQLLAGAGLVLGLAPPLVWGYGPGGREYLKAHPDPMVIGAFLGLALTLAAVLRSTDAKAWGLGTGDFRWWRQPVGLLLTMILVCIPIVAWIFPDFAEFYPRYKPARAGDPLALLEYQVAMGIYMFSWEYLFRGFVLFGCARYVGPVAAILIQAFPFFLLHDGKPEPEFAISWFGGILMGWLCWRARCMWPSFLLHWILYATMEVSAFGLRALG